MYHRLADHKEKFGTANVSSSTKKNGRVDGGDGGNSEERKQLAAFSSTPSPPAVAEAPAAVEEGATTAPGEMVIRVEVPADAKPGQQLRVSLPSGQSLVVTVPPNAVPGGYLQLQVRAQRKITVSLPSGRGRKEPGQSRQQVTLGAATTVAGVASAASRSAVKTGRLTIGFQAVK